MLGAVLTTCHGIMQLFLPTVLPNCLPVTLFYMWENRGFEIYSFCLRSQSLCQRLKVNPDLMTPECYAILFHSSSHSAIQPCTKYLARADCGQGFLKDAEIKGEGEKNLSVVSALIPDAEQRCLINYPLIKFETVACAAEPMKAYDRGIWPGEGSEVRRNCWLSSDHKNE